LIASNDPEKTFNEAADHIIYQINNYTAWLSKADLMPNPVYFRDREQLRQTGGLKVVDPDTAITMIRDFFSKVPVTHYYSWTLPPGLPLRTLPGQLWADRSSIACSYALGYLEPQIREILMDMKGGWRYELRYHRTLVA